MSVEVLTWERERDQSRNENLGVQLKMSDDIYLKSDLKEVLKS